MHNFRHFFFAKTIPLYKGEIALAFFNESLSSIYKSTNSSENGLASQQVKSQRERFGANVLKQQKSTSFFASLFSQFKNIMIVILLISATLSITMALASHDYQNLFEGILIFVIVIINAVVGVIQERKAENALLALQKSTEPFAMVLRDAKIQKIKTSDIVVGDIIFIKTGNRIPADLRLITSTNLKCDESSLTGESESVIKNADSTPPANATIQNRTNMCFAGTSVTSGHAKGIVVSTGQNTEFGKIAESITTSTKTKTPLAQNIDRIGKLITYVVLGIVFVVFMVQVLLNKNILILDALLTAIALAVAAIPESLPAVITIIMAMGVQKLAKQNAIIKKLNAVETLGSCNIICTDKTGTLTQNKMVLNHVFSSMQVYNSKDFCISNNPSLVLASALCSSITIDKSGKITGDATETAIAHYLQLNGINIQAIKTNNPLKTESEFSSIKKTMSVVCKTKKGDQFFTKGAIDYILPNCTHILINNSPQPLTESLKQKIISASTQICALGERVIALAYSPTTHAENDLIFIGFYGIIDPPRKEVFSAIKQCKTAGLKPIMITGDHPETAFAIAKKIGVSKTKNEVLTGTHIDKLSLRELSKIIDSYSVFARVTPKHKLKIVQALKQNGNIVAMTGDGINDAPSIKTANIGVCMGITGTDVTKEVADVIIADDNFSTIVLAIKQGRTIYQNITKTIIFLLSTNLVEVLGLFVTSLVMPSATFLSATQILFINLVSDSLPAFALGIEPAEKNIMNKPPRPISQTILSGANGWTILYQGFAQTLIVLLMFVICTHKLGAQTANTMSFLTICIMQLVHAINCKTESSIFKMNIFRNKFFNFSFLSLLALTLLIYFSPAIALIFNLTQISASMWIVVILTSLSIIPIAELGKIFIK